MTRRPYVLLSAAMSADGYIDDSGSGRLILSDEADFDRVDAIRAGSDAILVGAGTVRLDNPRLRVRSAARRAERERQGRPSSPVRVTVTGGGSLDPAARFFAADDKVDRLVYAPATAAAAAAERLGPAATVVGCGDPLSLAGMLADLAGRGIGRLMVEGGAAVLGQFLAAGLADELQLAVAPVIVADEAAPRLIRLPGPAADAPAWLDGPPGRDGAGDGGHARGRDGAGDGDGDGDGHDSGSAGWPRQLRLVQVSQVGRMALLRYQLASAG
jgi:5-amino-6-(5-phosphoribosylamino)uracil reductase